MAQGEDGKIIKKSAFHSHCHNRYHDHHCYSYCAYDDDEDGNDDDDDDVGGDDGDGGNDVDDCDHDDDNDDDDDDVDDESLRLKDTGLLQLLPDQNVAEDPTQMASAGGDQPEQALQARTVP